MPTILTHAAVPLALGLGLGAALWWVWLPAFIVYATLRLLLRRTPWHPGTLAPRHVVVALAGAEAQQDGFAGCGLAENISARFTTAGDMPLNGLGQIAQALVASCFQKRGGGIGWPFSDL